MDQANLAGVLGAQPEDAENDPGADEEEQSIQSIQQSIANRKYSKSSHLLTDIKKKYFLRLAI